MKKMAINKSFAGVPIMRPGAYFGPILHFEHCKVCNESYAGYEMKNHTCSECSENIWKILLDEEVSSKGIEEETGPIITAL